MPRLAVDDLQLHYVDIGSGPVLVFLHGLGGSVADWEQQIPHFSHAFRVIAPELRGFGQTPRGHRWVTIPRLARDISRLLQQLGVERYTLVGHSMGGAVAQQMAIDAPAPIERLVICNSLPSFRPRRPRHFFEFGYRYLMMATLGPKRLAQRIAWKMYPEAAQSGLRAKTITRGARNSRCSYLAGLTALTHWRAGEALGRLPMPVLVIEAEHDYFAAEDIAEFSRLMPQARLRTVAGAHHALPTEFPAAFNAELEAFFIATEMEAMA